MMQLKPTLPVEIAEKGEGLAFVIIDYGEEHHLLFVTVLDVDGSVWCAPNPTVRVRSNWSFGRG